MSERLILVAGPTYVDLTTREVAPPTGVYHSELRPEKRQEGWKREVGGTAWKLARHWAKLAKNDRPRDRVVMVTKVARRLGTIQNASGVRDPGGAFVDEGRWLTAELRKEAAAAQAELVGPDPAAGPEQEAATPALRLRMRRASRRAGVDYTFHLQQPAGHPWPILTLRGGSAAELGWKDVLAEWARARPEPGVRHVVILCGVLRTKLLPTLAMAIASGDAPTQDLLDRATLVIDFGRVDEPVGKRNDVLAGKILSCVRRAGYVLADRAAVREYDLLEPGHLPETGLVLRAVPTGAYWLYRRAGGNGAQVVRRQLEVRADDVQRPQRDGAVLHGLFRPAPAAPPAEEPYRDYETLDTPEKLTGHEPLLVDLRRIERLLATGPVGRLLARGRTAAEDEGRVHVWLIYGESGTGKEKVARWASGILPGRSKFYATSCALLGDTLAQSTLFGHVKGSFTSADRDHKGKFKEADGGVLLLDDLDNLPPATQAMLLRVIEDGQVTPVGGSESQPVDVFLIVTTNVRPERLVETGRLREDLYYRLISRGPPPLILPPLRHRRDDAVRAAEGMWRKRGDVYGRDLPLPAVLARKLRDESSPLAGNYRIVEAVVNAVFHESLLPPGDEEPGPDGDGGLSPVVQGWLARRPPDDGEPAAPPPDRAAPRPPGWLEELCGRSGWRGMSEPDRCDLLFREWAGHADEGLSNAVLAECLAVPPARARELMRGRAEIGRGRGAEWRLPPAGR